MRMWESLQEHADIAARMSRTIPSEVAREDGEAQVECHVSQLDTRDHIQSS